MSWFKNLNQLGWIETGAWGIEKDHYNRVIKPDPLFCYSSDLLKKSYIVRILQRTSNETIIERV